MLDPIAFGRFTVVRRLGKGNFSRAYLCDDPDLKSPVVVKLFNPECAVSRYPPEVWRYRFLEEARLLARLDHPNIIRVKGFGRLEDATPYYVMPFMPSNLAKRLGRDTADPSRIEELPPDKRPRRLPPSVGIPLLRQALQGLSALHSLGIVHRDIKPRNFLLEGDILKLSDFTMVKTPGRNLTHTRGWMGTEDYISPEQRKGAKYVDERTDIYSLGVIAYRMLTGMLPKGVTKPVDAVNSEVNGQLSAWVAACLSADRDGRPKDAEEALAQLNHAACGETPGRTDEPVR